MFPKDKTRFTIKTRGLPGLKDKKKFEFTVSKQNDFMELTIPGTPRGYDLIEPSSKKQEAWLRGVENRFEKGFREVWYCTWQFDDERTLANFLKLIKDNIIEEKYL
jgi:hypothetical protein